jgi:PAS domain S-box-containing protein
MNYQDSQAGFWEWNILEQTISNPILMNLLGNSEDQLADSMEHWRKMIHPEDWGKLMGGLENQITNNPQGPLVEEIRFFHKDGFMMYILFIGKVTEVSSGGMALKMVGSHIDITSQKSKERTLEQVNSLLSETSRIAMLGGWEFEVGSDTLNWTDFTKEIFEVDENFIPKRGDNAIRFVEMSERDRLQTAFNLAITDGTSFDLDFPIITAKGNRKWIRCTCQPTFEGQRCVRLFGVVQDITEREKAKEALQIKEQQLSTFIKYSPVAICMMDKQMNYIAASDIWKSFFNLNDEDVRGKNQFEIFPQTPEIWRNRYKSALNGEVLKKDEDSFMLPDGSVAWLEWEIRPWYELPGQIGGIIIYTAVISDKRAFNQALIEAKNNAEQALLMKSKFLSVMSHEMRTPLNAVIGFINLLMQDPRPDQIENMNVLRFSAENLLLLINDVLDFSKLDADKVELEEREFSLNLLLNNIVASLKHEATSKNLDLQLISDNSIPEFIVGDSRRLSQILINLTNNALKFTHAGSVHIICQLVESNQDTVKINFMVQDTGIGIPPEHQEHIFDMFSQADSDTTRKYGGTGLGLTISKRLLELMGSQIRLSSSPITGSTFSFEIVFRKDKHSELSVKDDEVGLPLHVLEGARILIVEDNPVNVLLMQKFLTQFKCSCTIAMDGSVAYDLVKSNDFDLILMDLQMPVMDGYMATRYIRGLPGNKYQTIPIIALSATDRSEIEGKLQEAGITDFVSKPFVPKMLTAILVQYISESKKP